MTRGRCRLVRLVGCCALVLGSGVFSRALSQPLPTPELRDFGQLMAAFERMPGLEARFVEEKHIGLLARPLESRGQLFFTRPGLFLRRVERPSPSEVVINDKELILRDGAGEQRIDLGARAEIRPFVESMTWLLAGNQQALRSVYQIEFVPAVQGDSAATWSLVLTPKQDPIARLVASIRVLGRGLSVSEIQVHERGGDESVTRILDANPKRHFTRAELARLFGVGAPARSKP
jgi:outer membrane lipoprotein-sorting protein